MRDLHNKMEDERGGGASVIDAAKKVGLPFTTIEAMDRSGRAPDGGPVAGLPPTLDIVTPVFAADVGSDNDPLQINRGPGDSGYVWYDVLAITPSRERTLDEVKDRVAARWRDDQIEKRLRAKTDEMVEQLKRGGKLADLAQAAGLKVETAASFKRGANVPGMSAAGAEAVFVANKGEAGTGRRRAGRPARGLCRDRHHRAEDRSRLGRNQGAAGQPAAHRRRRAAEPVHRQGSSRTTAPRSTRPRSRRRPGRRRRRTEPRRAPDLPRAPVFLTAGKCFITVWTASAVLTGWLDVGRRWTI